MNRRIDTAGELRNTQELMKRCYGGREVMGGGAFPSLFEKHSSEERFAVHVRGVY